MLLTPLVRPHRRTKCDINHRSTREKAKRVLSSKINFIATWMNYTTIERVTQLFIQISSPGLYLLFSFFSSCFKLSLSDRERIGWATPSLTYSGWCVKLTVDEANLSCRAKEEQQQRTWYNRLVLHKLGVCVFFLRHETCPIMLRPRTLC